LGELGKQGKKRRRNPRVCESKTTIDLRKIVWAEGKTTAEHHIFQLLKQSLGDTRSQANQGRESQTTGKGGDDQHKLTKEI